MIINFWRIQYKHDHSITDTWHPSMDVVWLINFELLLLLSSDMAKSHIISRFRHYFEDDATVAVHLLTWYLVLFSVCHHYTHSHVYQLVYTTVWVLSKNILLIYKMMHDFEIPIKAQKHFITQCRYFKVIYVYNPRDHTYTLFFNSRLTDKWVKYT